MGLDMKYFKILSRNTKCGKATQSKLVVGDLLVWAISQPLYAANFSFQILDNAGAPTFNQLLGINNTGNIAGYFGSGAPRHPNHGHQYDIAAALFTAVNHPLAE
jgi:hypothetical protein